MSVESMRLFRPVGVLRNTCCWLVLSGLVAAQAPLRSPEVGEDGQVTFRCRAPGADKVEVRVMGGPRQELRRGDSKRPVYEVTLTLEPGIHEYLFVVDGVQQLDLHNGEIKRWRKLVNLVEVPSSAGQKALFELQDVPRGAVHHHWYRSSVTGTQRPLVVYTPPGYRADAEQRYPVMVLLHGNGDDETAWVRVGKMDRILDNLQANTGDGSRPAPEPMIVAMPNGHVLPQPNGARMPGYDQKNNAAVAQDVVRSVLPFLASTYRVEAATAARRAIVGLSMGGGQALHIGLQHPDVFGSIGAFSAAPPRGDLQAKYGPNLAASRKLLWIRCGRRDFLLERNQDFVRRLRGLDVLHDFEETAGGHSWGVWRRYLPEFCARFPPPPGGEDK